LRHAIVAIVLSRDDIVWNRDDLVREVEQTPFGEKGGGDGGGLVEGEQVGRVIIVADGAVVNVGLGATGNIGNGESLRHSEQMISREWLLYVDFTWQAKLGGELAHLGWDSPAWQMVKGLLEQARAVRSVEGVGTYVEQPYQCLVELRLALEDRKIRLAPLPHSNGRRKA